MRLHGLDGRPVASLEPQPRRQRQVRKTKGSREGVVAHGPPDAKHRRDGQGAVARLGFQAEIDIPQRLGVAAEPAGLDREGAPGQRIEGPVRGRAEAAAGVAPLHAKGERLVRDKVVAAGAGVCYYVVGRHG